MRSSPGCCVSDSRQSLRDCHHPAMSNRRATSGSTTLGTRLGVFGTGYAGLVTAVCFAELGHTGTAIDKDPDVVARLSDGTPTIHEPRLPELLTANLEAGTLRVP